MLGSLLEPYNSLAVVHLYANALIIAEAQVALCSGVPLFSGLAVELNSLGLIYLHAGAQLVAQAQGTGGGGIARLLCPGVQRYGLLLVPVPVSYTHLDVYKRQGPAGQSGPGQGGKAPH